MDSTHFHMSVERATAPDENNARKYFKSCAGKLAFGSVATFTVLPNFLFFFSSRRIRSHRVVASCLVLFDFFFSPLSDALYSFIQSSILKLFVPIVKRHCAFPKRNIPPSLFLREESETERETHEIKDFLNEIDWKGIWLFQFVLSVSSAKLTFPMFRFSFFFLPQTCIYTSPAIFRTLPPWKVLGPLGFFLTCERMVTRTQTKTTKNEE